MTDWHLHVDSVLFAYRSSVCEATGFSPLEIVTGRKPAMPVDIQYEVDPSQLTEEAKRGLKTSASLRDAYRFVYDRQVKVAMRNKARRDKGQECTTFLDGDAVMSWDYVHALGHGAVKGVRKFKYRTSGPHEVVRADPESVLHYHIRDRDSGGVRKVHVNRLRRYYPVPEDLRPACGEDVFLQAPDDKSESPDPESARDVSRDDSSSPKLGDMIIVGCEPSDVESVPWAVAKVLSRDDDGAMVVLWYGNAHGRLTSAWRPGFHQPSDGRHYYKDRRDHSSHVPYTSEVSQSRIEDVHVIAHGFSLTTSGKVPRSVLKRISSCPDVAWELSRDC
jgi:hypothetical protein